eukprot:GILK01001401.1.p1 GENE.GILK01001401.1~~GILK01001401.1.p1  ORF type:complete len:480 (+),score=84.67 GILK01001401.1:38-1477(+)
MGISFCVCGEEDTLVDMPIDINLLREEKGGNPDIVIQSETKRCKDLKTVQNVIELDKAWRKARFAYDQTKAESGKLNKIIAEKKKASKGQDKCTEEIAQQEALSKQIEEAKEAEEAVDKELQIKLRAIGNIVHESVPISDNEDNNRVERRWGTVTPRTIDGTPGNAHHHEVLAMIDGYDPERGVNVAGHRGYFLKGPGVMLNLALINYGVSFLNARQYTALQPPYFMKKDVMAKTAQLSQFDEELYKVVGDGDDDKYLIATAEQPISAMHLNEWIEEEALPIRYAGVSPCFRKEAGSHGRDTWGIFRIHQFEKVEQFCLTTPEKSWEMQDEMIAAAEAFYQSLELPYQVINIVSGALNDAAARKLDLEAWFPGYGTYRELVSCSNCTDYQSRALEIRCGMKKQGEREKRYVHLLNATLCATERTLCCILENYQTPEGVRVPRALVPFMGGVEFIPYTKPNPFLKKAEAKAEKATKQEAK